MEGLLRDFHAATGCNVATVIRLTMLSANPMAARGVAAIGVPAAKDRRCGTVFEPFLLDQCPTAANETLFFVFKGFDFF